MADSTAEFGALLRRRRLKAGLTIEGLAETSGISARGIGKLERGERTVPQRRTMAALADGLGLEARARDEFLAATRVARAARVRGAEGDGPAEREGGSADFVGRAAEMARLTALADEASDRNVGAGPDTRAALVVAVSGAPGTGKTTLALQTLRETADRFPGGRLMVDLRGMDAEPLEPPEVMLRVLKRLGVTDKDLARSGPQGHPELYRAVLAERRCLLVLDNARDEAQVRPLLPGTGAGMTLITSRRMLTGLENVHRLRLGVLSVGESAELLSGLVGVERAGVEPGAVAEVAERCGYLPLALRVAGNWLVTRSGWSVRRLADRLGVEERRLGVLSAGDVRVSAAFDLSYRQLTPEAGCLFRLLALVDGPDVGVECAAALAGWEVVDAEDVLEELVEVGLLVGSGSGRYSCHDLLRLFARERLRGEVSVGEVEAARVGLRRWLLETVVVAGRW
ncbi:helix-turn-helix domain-containing protein [Streptomyces zhihengii]|uniref:helix-turn-helix domain-containing protein n=1 Tax=Streptomyces zhihengii TaxID=1818004 RepID=UPI0033A4DC86